MNGKRFAWQVMYMDKPFFFTLLILLRKFVYFEFCYPGCCKIAFYWRNAFACWDKKTRRDIDSMYMLHSFFVKGLLFSLWLYFSFFLCSILVLGFYFSFQLFDVFIIFGIFCRKKRNSGTGQCLTSYMFETLIHWLLRLRSCIKCTTIYQEQILMLYPLTLLLGR